ncbi:MAG: DNA translocase FtsK [Lachnospiraceae bacterium]|nr:DNA translocase FtsK [Lachnospiraceae bacterium]
MNALFHGWLGDVGCYIVFSVFIVIAFILLTDFSPSAWIREQTDPESEKNVMRREHAELRKEQRALQREEKKQRDLEAMRRRNEEIRESARKKAAENSRYVSLRGIGDTTLTDMDDTETGSTPYDDLMDPSIYSNDEEFVRNPRNMSKYGNSGLVTNMRELEERRKRGDTGNIPDIHVPDSMFPEDRSADEDAEVSTGRTKDGYVTVDEMRKDLGLSEADEEDEGETRNSKNKDFLFRLISDGRQRVGEGRRKLPAEDSANSTVPSDDPYRSVRFEKRKVSDEAQSAASEEPYAAYEQDDTEAPHHEAQSTPAPVSESQEAAAAQAPAVRKTAHVSSEPIPPVEIPVVPEKEYEFPPYRLLKRGSGAGISKSELEKELKDTAEKLQRTLATFGVGVTITNISCGPTVTRYEILPEMGVKVSKIVSLTDDIKLNLAAEDIRMEAPIPGKAAIGIEIPNKVKQSVVLRDLMESDAFKESRSKLAFAAGRDLEGNVIIADIARMPHVLVAGATGSGKSVCINTMIMSIIYHAKPTEVKMIMVDPKVVELSVYNGIPHLLLPVVTDPKKAASALNWAVAEMEKRYLSFAEYGVRGIEGYNEYVDREAPVDEIGQPVRRMPQILIIVDELADLMMVAPGDVENAICRLAQKARAAGIHLVLATQRPSVDVITGLIKANIPSRIAFAVSSGVDSRTILDMNGAEKLLGRGDMLYSPSGSSKPTRVQGAFVSDDEVKAVVDYVSNQGTVKGGGEQKIDLSQQSGGAEGSGASDLDEYFAQAGRLVIEKEKASIGMLQRAFRLGFNRAARIMDQLADAGVVGEEEGTKPRRILMNAAQFEQYLSEQGDAS